MPVVAFWSQLWKLQDHRVFFQLASLSLPASFQHSSVCFCCFFWTILGKNLQKKQQQLAGTKGFKLQYVPLKKKTFPWNWFGFRFSVWFGFLPSGRRRSLRENANKTKPIRYSRVLPIKVLKKRHLSRLNINFRDDFWVLNKIKSLQGIY